MDLTSTSGDLPVYDSILHAEYDVLKTIGRGTSGKAILVSRKSDSRLLVIKQVNLSELVDHEKAAALNEVNVLSQFDHINIIRYHACFTEHDVLHIVMEHATQGDLATLIQRQACANKPFTETEIMKWFFAAMFRLFCLCHGPPGCLTVCYL